MQIHVSRKRLVIRDWQGWARLHVVKQALQAATQKSVAAISGYLKIQQISQSINAFFSPKSKSNSK